MYSQYKIAINSLRLTHALPDELLHSKFHPYVTVMRNDETRTRRSTRVQKDWTQAVAAPSTLTYNDSFDIEACPTDLLTFTLWDDNLLKDTKVAEAQVRMQDIDVARGGARELLLQPTERFMHRSSTFVSGFPGGALGVVTFVLSPMTSTATSAGGIAAPAGAAVAHTTGFMCSHPKAGTGAHAGEAVSKRITVHELLLQPTKPEELAATSFYPYVTISRVGHMFGKEKTRPIKDWSSMGRGVIDTIRIGQTLDFSTLLASDTLNITLWDDNLLKDKRLAEGTISVAQLAQGGRHEVRLTASEHRFRSTPDVIASYAAVVLFFEGMDRPLASNVPGATAAATTAAPAGGAIPGTSSIPGVGAPAASGMVPAVGMGGGMLAAAKHAAGVDAGAGHGKPAALPFATHGNGMGAPLAGMSFPQNVDICIESLVLNSALPDECAPGKFHPYVSVLRNADVRSRYNTHAVKKYPSTVGAPTTLYFGDLCNIDIHDASDVITVVLWDDNLLKDTKIAEATIPARMLLQSADWQAGVPQQRALHLMPTGRFSSKSGGSVHAIAGGAGSGTPYAEAWKAGAFAVLNLEFCSQQEPLRGISAGAIASANQYHPRSRTESGTSAHMDAWILVNNARLALPLPEQLARQKFQPYICVSRAHAMFGGKHNTDTLTDWVVEGSTALLHFGDVFEMRKLEDTQLTITLYDDNLLKDTKIAEGTVYTRDVFGSGAPAATLDTSSGAYRSGSGAPNVYKIDVPLYAADKFVMAGTSGMAGGSAKPVFATVSLQFAYDRELLTAASQATMANSTKINGRRARTGVGAGGAGGMGGMAPAATAGMAGGALGAVPGMGGKHHVTDASIEHKDLMQVAPGIPASSTQPAVSGSSAAVAAHHAPDLMKPMAALHAIGSGHPGQPMPDQARGTTGGSGIRTNDVVMHHPGMVTADSAPLDASVGKVAMQDSGNVTLQGQPTNIFTAM